MPSSTSPSSAAVAHDGVVAADPDVALLEAWRSGDRRAADVLLRKYYPLIRRNVVTKVDADVVDDLVQKILVALVERRDEIREGTRLRAYVLTVTKYTVWDYYRRQERKPIDSGKCVGSSVRAMNGGPSSMVLAQEDDRILLEALRSVDLDDQFLLELSYWEGMKGPELAEVFAVPEGTIRSRLRAAKKRLRMQIEAIAAQEHRLPETLTDLDAWAQRLRAELRAHFRHLGTAD